MLAIRFQKVGRKKQPHFRIAVMDKKSHPASGKQVEVLGFYDPKTKDFAISEERLKYWLSVGGKLSGSVHNLLVSKGMISGSKVKVWKPKKKEVSKTSQPLTTS